MIHQLFMLIRTSEIRADFIYETTHCSQVLAGHPLAGKERGIHVLSFLQLLSPILHPEIEELWDTVLPKLIKYIEGERKQWCVCPGIECWQ